MSFAQKYQRLRLRCRVPRFLGSLAPVDGLIPQRRLRIDQERRRAHMSAADAA